MCKFNLQGEVMEKILVSINCITYNHEKYIAKAIEGFLKQIVNFNIEIIIGDDCSTDNTKKIIESYMKKNVGKITMISHRKNIGGKKNLNSVFKASKGKYIAICEGDDYWIDPFKLQKQVDYIMANEKCKLVCSNCYILNDRSKKITKNKECKSGIYKIEDVIKGGGGFIPTASILYEKAIMDNPPQFYLESNIADYPLQMILASKGDIFFLDDFTSVYRTEVEGSWTSANMRVQDKKNLVAKKQEVINILNGFNIFTQYRYEKEIIEVKLPLEFHIELINGNIKNLKQIQISKYRKVFDSMSIYSKFSTLIKCISPDFFVKIQKIIRGKK